MAQHDATLGTVTRATRHPPARLLRRLPWLGLGLWAMAAAQSPDPAPGVAPTPTPRAAVVLTLDGAIGPATADYIVRGLERAASERATLVVLRIDTPGGLDASMRVIVRAVLGSRVPVLSFVTPGGARAASAGTYILYASHVAAMAPGTNLGAATPIALGGGGGGGGGDRDARGPGRSDDGRRGEGSPGADGARDEPAGAAGRAPRDAAERKAVNDAVAYLRSLAELRGRDAAWAEEAVREGSSLSAAAAAERGVIDFVARDLDDALAQAQGRRVSVAGAPVTLELEGLSLQEFAPNWRTRMLGAITDPNVALILLTIGVYGLLFEFLSPGALFPGILGAICLLVGLYALSVLPVNIAGVALALLGLALMVAEGFTPTLGVLGIGGVVAFVFGAALLFDGEPPGFEVSQSLLAAVALAALAFTALAAGAVRRARRTPLSAGSETMPGSTARVLQWSGAAGYVQLAGERWAARCEVPLAPGQAVRVVARDGLVLQVAPAAPPDR